MTTLTRTVSQLSDDALLVHVRHAVSAERGATARLVALLTELDARRLYMREGCSSLFIYCTQVLRLSEHAAYGRIEAARAARRFPLILERLESGTLTLTAVGLLSPHLNIMNYREVLDAAANKSKREVEELVARLQPRPDVPTAVRKLPHSQRTTPPALLHPDRIATPSRLAETKPLAPERYKIQFTVDRATYDQLRRLQDLMRHTIPDGDVATIVAQALDRLFVEVSQTKLALFTTRPRAAPPPKPTSRHVPAAVRRQVWARDEGQCAYRGAQGRCRETGFLEFHHVIPFAAGGETSVTNLELRCRAHNAYEAERWLAGEAATPASRTLPLDGTLPR